MSKINELIRELCPEGVEFKRVWEVTAWDKKFNEVDNHKQPKTYKYTYLLASALRKLAVEGGDVKLLSTGGEAYGWTTEELAEKSISEGEIISIPWGGRATVQYYKGKFVTADNRIATSLNKEYLDNKYLYYFMLSNLRTLQSFYRGSGIQHPSMAKVLDMILPIPPIAVQREIVNILDKFTRLEAELEAELEARKKQYEYYRDQLLSFDESRERVEWLTLDVLAMNFDSKRKPVTKDVRTSGDIPYYGASGIVDYVSDYIFDGDFLLVSEDGANLIARNTPIAFSISGRTWVNNHAHVLKFEEYATRRLVEIYLNSIDLRPYVSGGAQPKLNKANLNKIKIPIPSMKEQIRVVSILDKFDRLVNSLSEGLPAEISARQKQYEYYRSKLLTFQEASV